MFFVGDDHKASVVLFFSVASLFCLGNALAGVSTTVMLADTVDYGEYKCGVRSEAIVFSVQTFTAKFGSAIALFHGKFTYNRLSKKIFSVNLLIIIFTHYN